MREAWLHPAFIERLQQPVDGDTPLMLAIRAGDSSLADALLNSPGTDIVSRNTRGETILYLALQGGEIDLALKLYQAGAPDAEDIISDERFPVDGYRELNRYGTATPQAEVERILSSATPRANMHPVTFEALRRLRSGAASIIEDYYPRTAWLEPLGPREAARKTVALSSLRASGVAKLGTVLSQDDIARIREYLAVQPIYDGHTPRAGGGRRRALSEIENAGGQGCYAAATALATPRLIDVANDPTILNIVADYVGCTPTITSVNVHWNFPHDRPDGQLHGTVTMHRDYNDYCQLALFIYLSDVDEGAGPHRYYMYTHNLDAAVERLQRRLPTEIVPLVARDLFRSVLDGHGRMGMVEDLFADDLADITGPAGTAFLADTFGFHRALPPRKAPRLFAWCRYGMLLDLPDRGPFERPSAPTSDKYDAYINRLLPGIGNSTVDGPAEVRLLVSDYAGTRYNICEFDGGIYAYHQTEGEFDIEKIRNGNTARPVFAGSSRQDVIAQIIGAVE
jgi:hypothetical protein